jgi:hypothetical protein
MELNFQKINSFFHHFILISSVALCLFVAPKKKEWQVWSTWLQIYDTEKAKKILLLSRLVLHKIHAM